LSDLGGVSGTSDWSEEKKKKKRKKIKIKIKKSAPIGISGYAF